MFNQLDQVSAAELAVQPPPQNTSQSKHVPGKLLPSVVHHLRAKETRKVLQRRYGFYLPADDAGDEDLRIFLNVRAHCYAKHDRERLILNQALMFAPWLQEDAARELAQQIAAAPEFLSAMAISEALNISCQEHEALQLRHLQPVGDAAGVADYKVRCRRIRDRRATMARRRKRGMQTREAYRRAVKSAEPWIAAGIPRSTWWRWKKAGKVPKVRLGLSST